MNLTRSKIALVVGLLTCLLSARRPASAQSNLAAARDGATIAGVSSSLGRDWRAANLMDGDPATTWASGQGKSEDQWVIIKLATKRALEIGAVAIDNSVAAGHPAEAGLRHFKIAVSNSGKADEDFRQIKLGSCRLEGGRQVFTFLPARAAFVKLILRSNHGYPDWIEFAEIEVFAAGEPPVRRDGTPAVLLHSTAEDASAGPFGPLVESLSEVGATISTFPGSTSSQALSRSALIGIRVVIVTGDSPLTKDDLKTLTRYCKRGGGLVCAVSRKPGAVTPLLEGVGVTVSAAEPESADVELSPHWVTEGLSPGLFPDPGISLTLPDSAALATRGGGEVVALAGEVGSGRLAVVPVDVLSHDGSKDATEFARRAVLWAAAMEDAGPPAPPEPVRLDAAAVFLDGTPTDRGLTFDQLRDGLSTHGLRLVDATAPMADFKRADLDGAQLLIAVMPALEPVAAFEIAKWVTAGGAVLVLGDAGADVPQLIRVNEFLREFGTAMVISPSKNLTVAVRRHPATVGVDALSRPGEPLGVWCLQGAALAEMASTPVAMARTFGDGRFVAMDAGLAVDPMEPPPGRKKAPPAYGIHLEQNSDFLVRCVAWLLGQN